jgi:hypothetical protein
VPDDLILPEAVSTDSLRELFEQAYMEVSVDSDGELVVKEDYLCYLRPDQDGRLILVYAVFGAAKGAQDADKLAFVNYVNDQIKLIRASISASGRFTFDYYIPVDGGVSRRSLVLAVRRFLSCLRQAIAADTGNVMA